MIRPSGYQVALNTQNLPQNYYFHHMQGAPKHLNYPGVSPTGIVTELLNFPLYKVEDGAFSLKKKEYVL